MNWGANVFYAMVDYGEHGERMSSDELQEKIVTYFTTIRYADNIEAEGQHVRQTVLERQSRIAVLYTNETKAAQMIRKGCYTEGVEERVEIGRNKGGVLSNSFCLDKRLSYLDLMVADAVYTLFSFGKEKFFVKKYTGTSVRRFCGHPETGEKGGGKAGQALDGHRKSGANEEHAYLH